MLTVLVTGAKGFVGRNLCVSLAQRQDVRLLRYDVDSTPEELEQALQEAEVIFHLAGVNRPSNTEEFKTGNADFTTFLCERLLSLRRTPLVVLSSSVQATLDNPYGHSKRLAEQAVESYAHSCAALHSVSNPESKIQNYQIPIPHSPPLRLRVSAFQILLSRSSTAFRMSSEKGAGRITTRRLPPGATTLRGDCRSR